VSKREALMAEERVVLAEEQTILARERTVLSFMQTGLAFAGIGLVVVNVLQQSISIAVGYGFIIVGTFEVIESLRRLGKYKHEMEHLKKRKRELEEALR
jgi:uncharacterized membrane protein YidH (DUF202 family)